MVEVSGRTYPVEVRYRPLVELPEADEEGEPIVRDQTEAIVDAVARAVRRGARRHPGVPARRAGDPRHRRRARRRCATTGAGTEVVPLYSRLSAAEQHRVFAAHTGRRVVLATNVAETSLTVPGIRYVVDTGVARIIALLGAHQGAAAADRGDQPGLGQPALRPLRPGRRRASRSGSTPRRTSRRRPEFTDPEILRTNLACVILQMTSLGLGDMARFPFVEPPDRRNVTAGVQLLEELGALTAGGRLTKVGKRLARLPIDPRLGRMILEAERLGCVREVLVIAAALSLQDPRERPAEHQAAGRPAARPVQGPTSDFLTWLNLWRYLKEQQRELSAAAFRRMCKREFLNYLRVREWQDFESQLRQVCKEMEIQVGQPGRRPPTRTASTRRCCPGCSATSGCSRSATSEKRAVGGRCASTSAPAARGSRSSRAAAWPGRTRSS